MTDDGTTYTKYIAKMLRAFLVAAAMSTAIAAAPAQSTLVDGKVTKIDQAAGKITIKHGPLKQFDMDEGMTMVYRAADPAMLERIKVGDKVKFTVDRSNGQFTVTNIEKAR
jgi:Cu(I)/Ag(I) efflux system periplasmic protein CusF